MRLFTEMLLDKQNLIGAEIGVLSGKHARELLEGLDIKMLHLVDPYSAEVEHHEMKQERYDHHKNLCTEKLAGYKNIKRHFKPSVEAAKDFEDCSLDFVYIDADHTLPAVVSDIRSWTPKVKKGGIVAGDDWNLKEVAQAVSETVNMSYVKHDRGNWYFIV